MKLQQLTALGDADFVREAYRCVLGREADEAGFTNYLDQVRSGVDKRGLLMALALSPEGRERRTELEGLAVLLGQQIAPRPGRLRRAIVRLMQPFRPEPLEPVLRQQRSLENRLYRIEALLQQQTAALRAVESRLARTAAASPPPQPDAGSPVTANPRTERLVPPSASRHYLKLVQALARRYDRGH